MKTKAFAIGDSTEMMCSACEMDTLHKVQAVTKQGVITKASCETCDTTSAFTRGVKTSVARGRGKTASPYDHARKYRKGEAMTHAKFGHGEVTAVIEPQKIDVLFGDQTRRLIHGRS